MSMEDVLLHITPWERSALQSLSAGVTPEQLASVMGISEGDIRDRLSSLFVRLGAASETDAIAVACRRGLIPAAPGRGA